jgi:hypothetical protein
MASFLSESERDRAKAAFEKSDADGSGAIDIWELRDTLRELGQEPTLEEVVEMVADGAFFGLVFFFFFCFSFFFSMSFVSLPGCRDACCVSCPLLIGFCLLRFFWIYGFWVDGDKSLSGVFKKKNVQSMYVFFHS